MNAALDKASKEAYSYMEYFMNNHSVPGLSVAVSLDGGNTYVQSNFTFTQKLFLCSIN